MIWNNLSPVLVIVNVLSNFKSLFTNCMVNFLLLYHVLVLFVYVISCCVMFSIIVLCLLLLL